MENHFSGETSSGIDSPDKSNRIKDNVLPPIAAELKTKIKNDTEPNYQDLITPEYPGRILTSEYSPQLKQQIAEIIRGIKQTPQFSSAILYLAAWRSEDAGNIWYEECSGLAKLLECNETETPTVIQQARLDYRPIYIPVFRKKPSAAELKAISEEHAIKGRATKYLKIQTNGGIKWFQDDTRTIMTEEGICYSTGTLTDVTPAMSLIEKQEKEGNIDTITGLPPLKHYKPAVQKTLAEYQRDSHERVLCLLNLFNLREINLKFGEETGNAVLQHFAGLLKNYFGEQAEIGKYAPATFYVIFNADKSEQKQTPESLYALAERILNQFLEIPFIYNGKIIAKSPNQTGLDIRVSLTSFQRESLSLITLPEENRMQKLQEAIEKAAFTRLKDGMKNNIPLVVEDHGQFKQITSVDGTKRWEFSA